MGVNHREHYDGSLTANESKKSILNEKYAMKPISLNDVEGIIISTSILIIADIMRLKLSLEFTVKHID